MPTRMIRALAVALAVAGCGTFLDGPPQNECGSDADCADGTCDLGRSMCVAIPPSTLTVGFEVAAATHPYGASPIVATFEPREIAGAAQDIDLALPLGVPVRGMVQWIGEPVTAAVTFRELSAIPGAPALSVETQSVAEATLDGDGPFNYAVELLPSRQYEVTVRPNGVWGDQLPPLRLMFMSTGPGTRRPQDLTYPTALTEIFGVIVDSAGNEQSGMIVRAHDASGVRISSTYTTGRDPERSPGYFVIRVAPEALASEWLLSINASTERIAMGSLTPTFTVDPGAQFPGEPVRIVIPPVSDAVIAYQGTVESRATVGEAATIAFVSNDVLDDTTGVIGTFQAMTTTAADGTFDVRLLPGTYEVVITPANPDLAIYRDQLVRIAPGTSEVSGQIFTLQRRVRFGGWAETSDSVRMFDARVRSQARGSTFDGTLDPVAVYARSNETLTDSMGQFDLPLDIGLYDVIVEPAAGTNWPWAIERDVPIGASGAPDDARTTVIQVGAPVPVSGRVFYGELDETPAARAIVRAYAILAQPSGNTRTMQIGQATADDDGRFTLLLPADP